MVFQNIVARNLAYELRVSLSDKKKLCNQKEQELNRNESKPKPEWLCFYSPTQKATEQSKPQPRVFVLSETKHTKTIGCVFVLKRFKIQIKPFFQSTVFTFLSQNNF